MTTSRQLVSLQDNPTGVTCFGVFDNNNLSSRCEINFAPEVIECPRNRQGYGIATIGIQTFTCNNCVAILGGHLQNNIVVTGQTQVTLPTIAATTIEQLVTILDSYGLTFTVRPSGLVEYTGTQRLLIYLTADNGRKPLQHTLREMLGFTMAPTIDHNSNRCALIRPRRVAASYGDVQGPTRDIIVACEEVRFTRHNARVCGLVSPSGPFGSVYTRDLNDIVRELDLPAGRIETLVFYLTDALQRPIQFAFGKPVMYFRIITKT